MIALLLLLLCSALSCGEIQEVTDYWPDVTADLSLVVWSHATNSRNKLEEALEDDTMMIEADVSLGVAPGMSGLGPIMAHPPAVVSDLSLRQFLETLIQATFNEGRKKGLKLDFKDIEVVEPSFQMLKEFESQIDFPFWVNADILVGPGGGGKIGPALAPAEEAARTKRTFREAIDPTEFFALAKYYFPTCTLSTGWVTGTPTDPEDYRYTMGQIDEMLGIIESNDVGTQPVTFPVRAMFVGNSQEVLEYLLEQAQEQQGTLTMWGTDDIEDVDQLRSVIDSIGRDRIYIDVSQELLDQLNDN